ncbi:MAG: bifunctional proline dehydrogenase/L-glutamate gamma-semialdehyde dehydrogenase [Actinobacteria bacterium]|nr:bifunctional proline dehydrogenase/L-glutamate gamma-semialdehyde dehydrogenase [Actinomycetota bacterium]
MHSPIVQSAAQLLAESLSSMSPRERRQQARLASIVNDPVLRDLTFALTDEVLRFQSNGRAARRLRGIVRDVGIPKSLRLIDRVGLRLGGLMSRVVPGLVMPLVRSRIVRESNGVVLSADDPEFSRHLVNRRSAGFCLNINVLGEAILSDAEADTRMELVRARIGRSDVDYVSLKVSSVVANLDVLAFEHSVGRICDRLRVLYRDAHAADPRTFVNLDMEEYRDLPMTIAAFTAVLAEPEFHRVDAGVVLQAYLPDSHLACDALCKWAAARHAAGGGRVKIRVVKGANLAMERVEAELHGWPQAPYLTKAEVDASFKRLVSRALDERWSGAIRVGFASHNLFDLAWALASAAFDRIDLEMLEGMAPAQSRNVRAAAGGLLLYAPVVRHQDLAASIAYLTRRLDENTSPENFLRALFTLRPGSEEWSAQQQRFETAVAAMASANTASRRTQDRTRPVAVGESGDFANCPDTDWTQRVNRDWIERALTGWQPAVHPVVETIGDIDEAVARARTAAGEWAATSFAERRRILAGIADEMERSRGATLAVMAHTACKTINEGDPEVSEAIDFARYYGWCTRAIESRVAQGRAFRPLGVVAVASPWNFPYAIPAGGVFAALAAGNSVILKPAPETAAVAFELVEQLHRSGVPRDLVQFIACADNEVGRRLISHDDVNAVILTGALETARLFRSWKPSIRIFGETSGKNALVISAAADEDTAIRDLVKSAFGHAGQKCSAASLAIVEAPLYDSVAFRRRLADAVLSVRVGAAADLATMTGPLIDEPAPKLLRALTTLDAGESWLVEPRRLDDAGRMWTPGVRLGVGEGSWFHVTECFGPVLGLMRARNLDHAIALQNAVPFGLTGGIHSLDEHEVQHWLAKVQVGNAYINRHITGAVVQRQPFGGWKQSSVGCGPKAGGPFYVEAFGTWSGGNDGEVEFRRIWQQYFAVDHDPSGLECERNLLRYRALPSIGIYVAPDADPAAVAIAEMAARVAGVAAPRLADPATVSVARVRVIGSLTPQQLIECHSLAVELDLVQPVADAMVELRRWVREQAVSWTRHRHGRLLD